MARNVKMVINAIKRLGKGLIFLAAANQLLTTTKTKNKGNQIGNRGKWGKTAITTDNIIQNICFSTKGFMIVLDFFTDCHRTTPRLLNNLSSV